MVGEMNLLKNHYISWDTFPYFLFYIFVYFVFQESTVSYDAGNQGVDTRFSNPIYDVVERDNEVDVKGELEGNKPLEYVTTNNNTLTLEGISTTAEV